MKLREEQTRLQGLLKETITMLCKNGLHFKNGFIIDALIGITTDDSETFLLNLEETVGNVGSDIKAEVSYDADGTDDGGFRASRKRNRVRVTDGTPTKRLRADSNDDDSDHDYQDDDYDHDNGIDHIKNEQDDIDLILVKQEQSDHDGQNTLDDNEVQAYSAHLDGVSHDGSSSTWEQCSTSNNNTAPGSQQVCTDVYSRI